MTKIKIIYDMEKDIQNYDNNYLHQRYPSYGRKDMDTATWLWPSINRKLVDAPEAEKLKIIRKYLEESYQDKQVTKLVVDSLTKYWGTIESGYFDKLKKYMNITKPINNMTAYITTLGICPYNRKEGYFYASFFSSLAWQTKTIMHESMHLVFLDNYERYLIDKGIDKQGILEINEALAVLLNWEFKEFLLFAENNKKPSTMDLQDEVVKLYKEKKTFIQILDRLIKLRNKE